MAYDLKLLCNAGREQKKNKKKKTNPHEENRWASQEHNLLAGHNDMNILCVWKPDLP
jgi:hypothetical protein